MATRRASAPPSSAADGGGTRPSQAPLRRPAAGWAHERLHRAPHHPLGRPCGRRRPHRRWDPRHVAYGQRRRGAARPSAAQLLVDLRGASGQSLSGTVVQTSNLGLPQIPGLTGQGSGSPASTSGGASLTSVVSGTHTWRVWGGGPDTVAGRPGEWLRRVRRHPQRRRRLGVVERREVGGAPHASRRRTPAARALGVATDLPTTPEEAAAKALAAIDPSTAVTTAGTAVVAGRQAYELVLDPDRHHALAQVRIAVDAEKHVPLRVQVYDQGGQPGGRGRIHLRRLRRPRRPSVRVHPARRDDGHRGNAS